MKVLAAVAALVLSPAAWGQNSPHLAYALPAGGQQGASITVMVGGQFLPNVSDVTVSGRGVLVTVGEHVRPINGMQATELRDRMQELQKQTMSDAVWKEMLDVRRKLLVFNSTRSISPVLAETLTLQVNIASDAPPGKRELRVLSPQGLSNPLVFYVGQLPEFTEAETIERSEERRVGE